MSAENGRSVSLPAGHGSYVNRDRYSWFHYAFTHKSKPLPSQPGNTSRCTAQSLSTVSKKPYPTNPSAIGWTIESTLVFLSRWLLDSCINAVACARAKQAHNFKLSPRGTVSEQYRTIYDAFLFSFFFSFSRSSNTQSSDENQRWYGDAYDI